MFKKRKFKRYFLEVSPELDAVMELLAARLGFNTSDPQAKAQVMRGAIILMDYLASKEKEGKLVLLRDKTTGESTQILVRLSA